MTSDARIYSIEEERAARQGRDRGGIQGGESPQAATSDPGDTSGHRERARCEATTEDGRRCRNYAVAGDLCRVHAAGGAGRIGPSDGPSGRESEVRGAPRSRAARDERQVGVTHGGASTGRGVELVEGLGRVLGDGWSEHVAEVASYLRRRVTADFEVDEFGFDPHLTENALLPLLRPMYRYYWRVRSVGHERIPDTGALLVANHAGTIPADAMMVKLGLYDEIDRHVRLLGADLVWRLPFVGEIGRKMGNTMACDEDAHRLLESDELVGVWPEGFKGIGKRYKDRYKLQRFGRGGFVEIALRAQAPIIPTAIIGSEEIYPLIYNFRSLARVFGLPYFPVTPTFPLLGPAGLVPLPSKWIIEYGEPIDTREYGPGAAEDPMAVFDLTDRVRDTIQQMIYDVLMGRRSIFF